MNDFPVAGLPAWPVGGVPTDVLADEIAEWVGSAAMTALVEAFGGARPEGDVASRLAYLDDFSIVWDGRAGRERLHAQYVEYDDPTRELVAAAAAALGLTGRDQPPADRYDHVLVLGGGPVTGRARSRYAADLLTGGTTAGTVTGLGSLRPLPVTSAAQPPGSPELTEGDGMLMAIQEAFPAQGDLVVRSGTTAAGHDWWVKTYPWNDCAVSVVAAPPTRPGQRANTADTLLGWAELVSRPTPEERVLIVTTDLYVPFQHAAAVNTLGLPYGCGIDTVGFSTRTFHAWPKGPSHPSELLQELRSAIRSLRTLLSDAEQRVRA